MKLSIIIVSYNTKDLLEKCLESVYPTTNTEIIVVDNASSDGTVEMIKKEFPAIKLIENRQNLGFAKAVNQALRQGLGEVFFLLNSDTIVKKDTLNKLLEFEEKVRPAVIGARMLNPDGSVQGSVFNLPTIKMAFQEFWLSKKGSFSKYFPTGNQPVEVEAVSGGAMMISKKVVEEIGLFDERYFMYFEDLDYCRKARRAGFKVRYLPKAEVIHEHGVSGRNLVSAKDQWRRLVPSSKIYHGLVKHYLINFIIFLSQKWQKIFG